jgi:putative flippase GtrA
MIRAFGSRQFLTFLFAGGVAAIANFGSRLVYERWCTLSMAVLCAYLTGMLVAFVLNKMFVFTDSKQRLHASVLRFTIINIIGFLQTWLITMALVTYVFPALGVMTASESIAHAIGIAVPVFTSYLGHKYWSFQL